jgi:peptidoglycan/LPS O-acetylase OafA/YrhL
MNLNKINSNIQFLRGASVLMVFFFHFNQYFFNTFFVGVDIFFLVSGYVITNSVFNKKKFSITNYFLKRIKRIYPNLIFIILFFFIIFNFFYKNYVYDYTTNFFSVIFTLAGVSNLYYSLDPNLFYFNKEIRWLLHTWSLSIELQFYLLFGLIAFLSFKLKQCDIKKFNFFKFLIVLFFLISIFLFFFTDIKFVSDYYSFPARIWEFILGSSLYFINQKKKINFIRIFVLFIIILSFLNIFYLDYKLIVIFTLISIFGILHYSKEHNVNSVTKIIVYFGKISYSFYLWHLIIISFLKNYFELEVLNFVIIFFLTTIFSHFSYNFIELKFNKKLYYDYWFEKKIKFFSFIITFLIIYFSVFNSNYYKDFFNKLNKISINLFKYTEKNQYKYPSQDNNMYSTLSYDFCEEDYEDFSWSSKVNCIKKDKSDTIIFVFGNSYGEHLVPGLYYLQNTNLVISRFDNIYLNNQRHSELKLGVLISKYKKITQKFKKKIVLISLNERNYSIKKIKNIILKINDENTKIILLYPHPSIDEIINDELFSNYEIEKKKNILKLEKVRNIKIFDTFDFLCEECNEKDYSKLFIDGAHLSLTGSLKLLYPLKKAMNLN